jgi:hypothetical protein
MLSCPISACSIRPPPPDHGKSPGYLTGNPGLEFLSTGNVGGDWLVSRHPQQVHVLQVASDDRMDATEDVPPIV